MLPMAQTGRSCDLKGTGLRAARAEAEISPLRGLALADAASSLQCKVEGSLCTELRSGCGMVIAPRHETAERGLALCAENLALDLVRAIVGLGATVS